MTFVSTLKRWRKRFAWALFIGGATIDRTPDIGNKLPILAVTTKHGTALVPENFPHRESLDEQPNFRASTRGMQSNLRVSGH
jgi:hypothetical protein